MKKPEKKEKKLTILRHIFFYIFFFILLLLTLTIVWASDNFVVTNFEEIVFTLRMPLKGAADSQIAEWYEQSLFPSLITTIALFFISFIFKKYVQKKVKYLKNIHISTFSKVSLLICWGIMLAWVGQTLFGVIDYMVHQTVHSDFIEQEYVDPQNVEIKFPSRKRNLIWIYMESTETSVQNYENGGLFDTNYIPELTTLAKENISFSQSELIEGAMQLPGCGTTVSAITAQTTGLPLKIPAYHDNSMNQYEYFLPGATSLGDILENAGYQNYFMGGSNFDFAGKRSYLLQHGSYSIWDLTSAIDEGLMTEEDKVFWGFEDAQLFEYAKEHLLEISKSDQPFNFSMLTVDTHYPEGYTCELCPDTYDSPYANVWTCASKQVTDFVDWIQQQDFYENTTVVITGDHISMATDFYPVEIDFHVGSSERKVYNVFINSPITPVKETNRVFSTLDMFPTVLAGLGAEIENNRLGLGTNLFSEETTLLEQYGYEKVNEELSYVSNFYNETLLYP